MIFGRDPRFKDGNIITSPINIWTKIVMKIKTITFLPMNYYILEAILYMYLKYLRTRSVCMAT